MNSEYVFRISGRIPPALTAALEPLKSVETSADTVLVGPVTDRAALQGYIAHLDALGLDLVELRRLPPGEGSGGHGCPSCGRGVADAPAAAGTAARSRS